MSLHFARTLLFWSLLRLAVADQSEFQPYFMPISGNVNPGLINHGLLIRGVPLQ